MILPPASWREQPGLERLLEVLDADAGATRFVGGAVRDTLLGHEVTDVDAATRLPPDEVLRRLGMAGIRAVPTGIAHGTVTAVLPAGPVEITTLRRDVSTDGRRATVAYTDDWREDAARRDFTINALSADPGSGAVHDYFGGVDDLAAGRVRFIGDALTRIAEDHLRILRFFRFHARFGRGAPSAEDLAACFARANDLMALSRERIADELLKLLAIGDPVATIGLMLSGGVFRPVLPEITDLALLGRLVEREARCGIAADPVRRLAALLPPEPEQVVQVAARLRLSKAIALRLRNAADRHARASVPADVVAYRLGRAAALDQLLLDDTHGAHALAAGVARLEAWQRPRLAVGGGDLIALGLKPGPVVAATLRQVERQWESEGFPDGERARQIAAAMVDQALRESQ